MGTSKPTTRRASGDTQLGDVLKAEAIENDIAEADEDPGAQVDPPRSKFRTLGLSRMKVAWQGEDALTVAQVHKAVDERVQANFADAYSIMHDLYLRVRTPEVDANGEVVLDADGFPVWRRTPSGGFEEDWSVLGRREREDFLFSITTRLFAWERAAADAWGEAMLAKVAWEERFSTGYQAPVQGTIDDRIAYGRKEAAEDRYFAVFLTLYSRRADAVVRVLGLLGQRIKDTMDLG